MASPKFSINPLMRFEGPGEPVRRPKEIAYFSYDDQHRFRLDDSSLKYYYPPALGTRLSNGFDTFRSHDDSTDQHIESLLATIIDHEQKSGKKIDAHVVTWRGMMTKIMSAPFDDRDGFEMNATLYQDCVFIEENHEKKQEQKRSEKERQQRRSRGPIPPEVMTYWGYKFEALSTLPAPWGETSRDYIENRDKVVVDNIAQYCSVVRTGIGQTILCLGGEVDCVWDSKPDQPGTPINWVELKTSALLNSPRDVANFERKLMKFWIQSFLLGVPRIIVGFRDERGILSKLDTLMTINIPDQVKARSQAPWDGMICINFASAFLDWLRKAINDEGVWRIRRNPGSPTIEVFKVEEVGHGKILTDDFINWRIKLSLNSATGSTNSGGEGTEKK